MRILYILEHYFPYIGGSERLFQSLAEAMVEKGHHVTVVTSRFKKEMAKKEYVNGVKVIRITARSRFSFTWKAIFALKPYIKSYDIIHTTTYNAALPAWISSKLHQKKVILTFHEVWGDLWFKLPFARWWERVLFYSFEKMILLLPFDHYIAVSKFTENSLISHGIPSRKVSQIYNGIQYDEFLNCQHNPPSPSPVKFIYFGRLGTSKGLDIIIQAFNRITDDHHCELHLVVPTTPKRMWRLIQKQVTEYDLMDKVIFHHNLSRHELFGLISTCHAALIPSLSEGFCFSAVEANAIGIPIIHSGKGALSEVLLGSNSIQVNPKTDDLLDGMTKFIENREDYAPLRVFWPISKTISATHDLYHKGIHGLH